MESYCLKCQKNTENLYPEVSSTSNGRVMISSKCAICGSKKLSKLGIRTPLSNVPILDDISF